MNCAQAKQTEVLGSFRILGFFLAVDNPFHYCKDENHHLS